MVVGRGRLIDPSRLARVYISPRGRAQETFELLFDGQVKDGLRAEGKVSTTEGLAEWGYGDYEGLKEFEIRALRKKRGLDTDREWDMWVDGCEGEGSETPGQATRRLDALISEIHALQSPYMRGEKHCDVLLVAHGHLLRAFTKRWLKYSMDFPLQMVLPPGGVGILSYTDHDVQKPALYIGVGFPLSDEAKASLEG
jgi:sedoheptulose-bisphosphatase